MSDATRSTADAPATPARPVASRLPARAALAAIALLLAGGGWYGYDRLHGTAGIPRAAAGDFLPDPGGRVRFAPAAGGNAVIVLPGNVVAVRANGLALRANARPDGKWTLNVNRGNAVAGDRQAVELVNQARRRILDPRRPQADLNVTDAQRAALALAAPDAPPELTPETFARVVDLAGQLTKLTPADARAEPLKAELLQIAVTAARADVNAIAAQYASRANAVRAALSPEQVRSLLGQRPAATRPIVK